MPLMFFLMPNVFSNAGIENDSHNMPRAKPAELPYNNCWKKDISVQEKRHARNSGNSCISVDLAQWALFKKKDIYTVIGFPLETLQISRFLAAGAGT